MLNHLLQTYEKDQKQPNFNKFLYWIKQTQVFLVSVNKKSQYSIDIWSVFFFCFKWNLFQWRSEYERGWKFSIYHTFWFSMYIHSLRKNYILLAKIVSILWNRCCLFSVICFPCSILCIPSVNSSHLWLSLICPLVLKCIILRDYCNVRNKIFKQTYGSTL